MSKFVMSIEWHESCLKNSSANCARKKELVLETLREVERWERDNELYRIQINAAKKQGKTHFDRDRFLVKKEKNK